MNERQIQWKQLQAFEKRGDLQKQAEILTQVLGRHLPAQALVQSLQMAFERATADLERQPPELYRLVQERQQLLACNSGTGETIKEFSLPREAGLIPAAELSWSPTGQIQMLVLETDNGKLSVLQEIDKLDTLRAGLAMNAGYSYLPLSGLKPRTSAFCRALYHPYMPLETVKALPLDLTVSTRHPHLAITDRGAGKLHLIQRESLRLQRSWPILPAPNKKALSVSFHPDGKRVFVSALQPGLLVMIDRAMAQKRIQLPNTHLIGSLGIANKGDLLYCLAVNPETRYPELWVLDAEKLKRQQVIHLEGEAFSTGADARDILEITPDGQYAVVMVSRSQPALFTPCLLLVDLASGQVKDQLLLRPNQKPINLAFGARELYNPKFRLLPMLLHGGYGLTEDSVKQAFGIDKLA